MTHPKCLQYFRKRVYKERIKFLVHMIRKLKAKEVPTEEEIEYMHEINSEYVGKEVRYAIPFNSLSWKARHYHIAASLLRGKTREEIERPRDNNHPIEMQIEKLYDRGEELAQTQYKEYLENEKINS